MSTRPSYATLVAAMGGFGPRARSFGVEAAHRQGSARDVAAEVGAGALAGQGRGLAGGFFDFIPEIVKSVPNLMAASGLESAQSFVGTQAALKAQELETQRLKAVGEAKSSSLREWVPWAAIGVGGLAFAGALGYAISRAAAKPAAVRSAA